MILSLLDLQRVLREDAGKVLEKIIEENELKKDYTYRAWVAAKSARYRARKAGRRPAHRLRMTSCGKECEVPCTKGEQTSMTAENNAS